MPHAGDYVRASDATKPVCVAYDNAGQSITNNTLTAVTFGAEYIDTDGMHSTSVNTGRLTFNTAGYWKVWGGVAFLFNATGSRGGLVRSNGTTTLDPTYTLAAPNPTTYATSLRLNEAYVSFAVGDYIELLILQVSGGNLSTTLTAGMRTYLAAEYYGTIS